MQETGHNHMAQSGDLFFQKNTHLLFANMIPSRKEPGQRQNSGNDTRTHVSNLCQRIKGIHQEKLGAALTPCRISQYRKPKNAMPGAISSNTAGPCDFLSSCKFEFKIAVAPEERTMGLTLCIHVGTSLGIV